MGKYRYRRLDTNTSEIRLVRIEEKGKGDAATPIRLTLRHAFLDGNVKFLALSYAWGDEPAAHKVIVGDGSSTGRLRIRNNLHHFLRVAETSKNVWSSQWIFIDQVCIDQGHEQERKHQVRLMGKLYSSALATIVWPESSAVETMECRIELSENNWNKPVLGLQELKNAIAELEMETGASGQMIMRFLKTQTVRSMYKRIIHSYWWRIWVIQEIVLASNVYILMPGELWNFRDYIWMFWIFHRDASKRKLQRLSFLDLEFVRAAKLPYARLKWMHNMQRGTLRKPLDRENPSDEGKQLRAGPFNQWHDVLYQGSRSNATYSMDRFYGLMGLIREDMQFEVDYTLSPRDVLIRVLHFYWLKGSYERYYECIIPRWYLIFEKHGLCWEQIVDVTFREGILRDVVQFEVVRSVASLNM